MSASARRLAAGRPPRRAEVACWLASIGRECSVRPPWSIRHL